MIEAYGKYDVYTHHSYFYLSLLLEQGITMCTKKQQQGKTSERGGMHFHIFSVSNTLWTACWHVRERRVTVLLYGKIDKLLREVQDANEHGKAYTNCDQEIVWI